MACVLKINTLYFLKTVLLNKSSAWSRTLHESAPNIFKKCGAQIEHVSLEHVKWTAVFFGKVSKEVLHGTTGFYNLFCWTSFIYQTQTTCRSLLEWLCSVVMDPRSAIDVSLASLRSRNHQGGRWVCKWNSKGVVGREMRHLLELYVQQ